MDQELTEEELQDLYAWIDKIPLSRPKRHITRDFSDGGRKLSFQLDYKGAKQAAGGAYFQFATWLLCGVWLKTLWVYALCCDLTASLLLFSHGCRGRKVFPTKACWPPQLHSCQLDPAKAQQLERPQQARQQSFLFYFIFFMFFSSHSMKCEGSSEQWEVGEGVSHSLSRINQPYSFEIWIYKICQYYFIASSQTIKWLNHQALIQGTGSC